MRWPRSITARLSLVFLFLFLLVIILGAFSIGSLSHFNDLTSDQPVAEASLLLARWLIILTIVSAGLSVAAAMIYVRREERRLLLLQRNFISMASHEFRTPLTVIDAHAQRLIRMKDRLSPEDLEKRAHKIRKAVLRMTRLSTN